MSHTLSSSEQLAHCTVRIEVDYANGEMGTGTGFFFHFAGQPDNRYVPAIVTNKHVIEGAEKGRLHVTLQGADGNPNYGSHATYEFDRFQQRWTHHPDAGVDLCAMPIAPLVNVARSEGKTLFYIPITGNLIPSDAELADMTMIEDVVMVGYPNGIWDRAHNMPIMRRGITATHPNLDWNGKPELLIDVACFPGSSGSPVFLFNLGGYTTKSGGTVIGPSRIRLLGILYAGQQQSVTGEIVIANVPTALKPISVAAIPINLGTIIKARKLTELDAIFTEQIHNELKS